MTAGVAGALAVRRPAVLAAAAVTVLVLLFVPGWHVVTGQRGWQLPPDLWGTGQAALSLATGHPGGVYGSRTALVALPGLPWLLAPAAGAARLLGLGLPHPGVAVVAPPNGWPLVGGAALALSLPALFAADAAARALGVPAGRRHLLAAGEAVCWWNVVVWWGHPEDALAVALVLWAVVAQLAGRGPTSWWLLGAAVAVQPLALLAAGVLLARVPRHHALRAAAALTVPGALSLAVPLLAAPAATLRAVVEQPNYPGIDHATAWTALAPHLGGAAVAAGPLRLAAVVAAVGGGAVARRRADHGTGDGGPALLWLVAAAFAVRVALEPVMVAYYVWPVLAVGLVAAARRGRGPLVAAAVVSAAASVFGDAAWRGNWSWWAVELGCVVTVLVVSRPRSVAPVPLAAPVPA